ncbi:transcription factor bHLH30-like [Bidens hawaiensis]|uniref:transcription factor bHLH30-like n=1 Tax=Bidens hawaiensis TaxID=980011 RepID=UPI00404B14C4
MNLYDYSSMFQPSLSSQIPQSIHHHTTGDYNNPIRLEVANHGPDIEAKTSKTTVQEMVDAKAIAASKSHSEAEIRRRERINNHLTKLRSLLPNTTKTDKATLLAEVIQHIKKLKHQTSMMDKQSSVPSETDELIIDNTFDEEGRIVIKASLCCEDRSDLMKDLVKTLKMLRLRTLKAEITTLGRRVKNVLFVTNEDRDLSTRDDKQMANHSLNVIEETLKALMEKTDYGDDSSFVSIKRQRTNKCSYCH